MLLYQKLGQSVTKMFDHNIKGSLANAGYW